MSQIVPAFAPALSQRERPGTVRPYPSSMRTLPIALLSTLAACATLPAATSAGDHALPFVENDFPRALKLAQDRKVPLFVDAWAPW